MAKPCIVKYKGKEYSVEQFSAMLHDGLLNNLIESGAIDQNKLKGDLKLLQDKGISFRYTLQEDGVSVILEGTEAINNGANTPTVRTGTKKENNLKYIDSYSFDDVLNQTYNTNSAAVSFAIKIAEGIFNYKKKNQTTGVVSKKSFVIPFINTQAANKLKKLRIEYKKLNPPESKEEKARKAEDKRLLTKEQLKQKQAEERARKAQEKKLLSKEEKKAIADKNSKDKKRSAKIKEEINQITKKVLVDFHKMMVLNLLAIYDTLDQKFVQLSKDWYLGANRFANAYANKYKLTVEQASAIIAVLSPQNDWFNNLSVAERVMEIMTNYSNTKMTADIIDKAVKNLTVGEDEKDFVDVLRVAFKKFGEVSIEDLRKMGATEEIQANYLRAFDHAFHANKVAMTDPTGKFIGFDTTPVRWNSESEITKAIIVYRDSDMATINEQLGGGSKVRNFYNNIVDPNSPTPYVTSDTHAAAAAMSVPMSALDAGTGFKLFDSGLNPVYAIVKQAYISASDIVGLFPREFQSITWEGTRLGINDKNRTEEKKNQTFNEVSKLRENQNTNSYENARAIIAINPSGDPIWGKDRGIKTQKSTFKDSESIRSDSDKRISQVSNYGEQQGRLRGDSTRVGGQATRGQTDTGEVSFRFEKSGTATIKNAPKGTYLNIGLLKGETEEQISIDEVLSKLPSDVKVIKQREVTGTEPTLALQISRKMSDQEMEDFRNATAQMAIPQLSDGKGVIHGTQEWGEFNPEFFVLPNNKQLSSIEGVEITSVEPNEEGVDVVGEVKSNWNYEGEGDAFASSKEARDGKMSYTIRILDRIGKGDPYNRARQRGELDTESPLTYKGDKESVSAIDGNGNTVGVIKLQTDGGIEHIVVAPEFSRKGVASELIKQIEQRGAKVRPEKSKIISPDAAKLFNKLQSIKPNEEGPSFRKNYEFIDLNTFDLRTADGANKLVEKLEGKALTSDLFRDRKFGEASPYVGFVKVFNEGKVLKRKDIQTIIELYNDGLITEDNEIGIADNTDIDKLFFESKKKIITVRDVLSTIANRKESPYSKIAVLLLKKGNTKGLNVVAAYSKRKGTTGVYSSNQDKITVGQEYSEKSTELVFIHEIAHAFTHKEVLKDQRTDIQKFNYDVKKGYEYLADLNNYINDDKANPHLKNLIQAYIYAVEQSGLTDKVFGQYQVISEKKDVPYGFINLDEFIAESFSNPKFQQVLNDIQMPGTKKSVWQTIVDAVREILGLDVKQGSVLESVLMDGAELINSARGGVTEEEGGISFRKEDKVKGSYFEPAMTTDSKGDYVFFHFSTAPLKSLMKGIDSRKYYSTRTSREEKGLQYGVASYYTKPTDSENVVGGDKYYVTVSPDKVYPMDLDPNGYRAAAEKKIKKNTPFRESKISKEIANAAARDGYEMAVGEWSYDRSGLTKSEIPEFRGDALVPLKPTEITGKEKFKTGEERGIKTEHPDRARLAFNQQVEDLASDIDSYKSSKGKYDDAYSIANEVMVYGGVVEDYGTPNQRVRPLTIEEFDTMTKGLPAKLKERASKLRSQMEDMGISFRVDEISFRADNTRRIVTELRLKAILKGSNFKDLRNAINVSPTSFYTPQKYAQLKPQIANMSNAELISAIDVENSLENIINVSDGPIVGLAFIEYINRLKNIVEDPNSTQTDIDDANQLIQDTYATIAPFTTKIAQILRQLGEIKSTIKKDEVQFYLDMIEALIEANGNMINDDHRQALKDIIQLLLNSKNNHTSLFNDLANKGSNVTDQDIADLNMAEVELQNANAALHMLVAFLSPPSTARFWAGVLKGNLMSIRSATIGLFSNIINISLFRVRNLVHAGISVPFAILHKAGVNVFGLEKYQLFNTSMALSNVKYALFLDVIQDALVGIAKAIATVSKMMIGKESFRGFLDKSPTANRVFNIIKYGSSGLEGGSPVEIDRSNHIMLSIKNAFTGKGQKTRLNIRGIKMDVANSYKRTNFSKWFKANYPGSDYNTLSAKDKKIIQNEYFNDPKAMVPTLGERAGGLGKAFMAWNSEAIFRLVALSDYLPKTYANNVEMTRLAQTLGLDEKQTILFMKDPAKYIEIVQNILSPEVLKFWTDTVAEVTVTKDTGIGVASVALVEGLKTYFPQKLLQKYPELKNNEWFNIAISTYNLFIDTIFPFVKIPMNFISLVSDYLIPSKPFAKALYFAGLALNNKGTDQADAYALSFVKNISTAVVAMGLRSLAVGLVAIPGMVVIAPGKDDDDEKRKMKSKYSRMSVNIDALKRYFSGEDPSYKQGDRYQGLAAYGVLGMNIYNYATINEKANQEYYDKLKNVPKNVNPKELNLGSPFDIKGAGWFELELKSFESSQNFIDQSWFVGLNSTLQGLTGGDQGADRFVNSYINTLLSFWWGFSSHAQQVSDIYREATGKPVFDVALPTNLQDINKEGYPGTFGDRVWNNIFKKNELIHKALMDIPEESEYIKFDMYGEPMTPVPGNTKNNLEIVLSVSGPMRTARTNLTKEERLYMAVYENKNKINIPGYELSLAEPTMNKTEKLKVFYKVAEFGQVAETINVMIMPKEYNKINEMAGDVLRDLHSTLLSEQGLLDFEIRGKKISPEDIMSTKWGNSKEVANVRNAIAVSISEGNKLLNTFLKPWELFSKPVTNYIGKEEAAVIQEVRSLIDARILTYKALNPNTGKMEMLSSYLVTNPELSNKLYNLAKESILLYLKAANEAINNNDKYRELLDNPEMTIEQEKARKEGNF